MADVTGIPVPTNASPFDVPGDIKKVADAVGDQTRYSVANAAALPASGNWLGRILMTQDTKDLYKCTALPGTWEYIANGVKRTTGSSGSLSLTLTSIMSLSLEAGTWEIDGQGYIEKATTGAQTFTAQLWNATASTEIDVAKIGAAGDAFWPLRVKDVVTLAATSTIQFRVATSALSGTQLFSNGKLFAKRAALI